MSRIKRAIYPELYQIIDNATKVLDFEEETPEQQMERAENIRDGLREDGINV